jgi:hypothetical protein
LKFGDASNVAVGWAGPSGAESSNTGAAGITLGANADVAERRRRDWSDSKWIMACRMGGIVSSGRQKV